MVFSGGHLPVQIATCLIEFGQRVSEQPVCLQPLVLAVEHESSFGILCTVMGPILHMQLCMTIGREGGRERGKGVYNNSYITSNKLVLNGGMERGMERR